LSRDFECEESDYDSFVGYRVLMAKITGWPVFDVPRLQRILRPYLLKVLGRLPSEGIADVSAEQYARAIELASLEYPSNWLLFYILGSKRLELNQLSASLAATLKCVELLPNYIRSAYALASIYNVLSYGGWPDDILSITRTKGAPEIAAAISEKRDAAKKDLVKLSLTPAKAAEMAICRS
jgi:hypothetical protein